MSIKMWWVVGAALVFATVLFLIPPGKRLVRFLAGKLVGGDLWNATLGSGPLSVRLVVFLIWASLSRIMTHGWPVITNTTELVGYGGAILVYTVLLFGAQEIALEFKRRGQEKRDDTPTE